MKKLFISKQLCTGCKECELMCSLYHDGSYNPALARIRVELDRSTNTSSVIFCKNCESPKCLEACLNNAMEYNEITNCIIINEDLCKKCYSCVNKCPFKAIKIAPDGKVLKCDLCGGEPVCVLFCSKRPLMSSPLMKNRQGATALTYDYENSNSYKLTRSQQIIYTFFSIIKNSLLGFMIKMKIQAMNKEAAKQKYNSKSKG